MKNKSILLPGSSSQLNFLLNQQLEFKNILIVGSTSENISIKLAEFFNAEIETIVEDFDSLLSSNIVLGEKNMQAKMMDFSRTDFLPKQFDLIFAQASISNPERRKILKEFKRILKPEGFVCVGEILLNEDNPPTMLWDFLENSNIHAIKKEELEKLFSELKYEVLENKKVENSFSKYFAEAKDEFKKQKDDLTEKEKSYYKKIIKKINHENNIFNKFRGERFLSLEVFLLKVIND